MKDNSKSKKNTLFPFVYTLNVFNSMSGKLEHFCPQNHEDVKMYVCGPTVYDRTHIGNLRSAIVYDIIYRILLFVYDGKVTYVRNITDVDDKIINVASKNGCEIESVTIPAIERFHSDTSFLNCLKPTIEPKVTENIDEIIALIQRLIESKHAYASEGHVLFSVESYSEYGKLSGRKISDMQHGHRVEIESYKKNDGDFVLWKPVDIKLKGTPMGQGWESPFGFGRPGWHIECSALSKKYLGENFDIHGGGNDLKFPHHENEIAQSICGNSHSTFAKYWIHNGFVQMKGSKMSKSMGNILYLDDLNPDKYGSIVCRYALTSSHYRQPLEFSVEMLEVARSSVEKLLKPFVNYFNIKMQQKEPSLFDMQNNDEILYDNTQGGIRESQEKSVFDDEDAQDIFKQDFSFVKEEMLEDLMQDINLSKYHAKMFGLAKLAKSSIANSNTEETKILLKTLFNAGLLIGLWEGESICTLLKRLKSYNE